MESGNYARSEGSKQRGGGGGGGAGTIPGQENSAGSQRGPAQELGMRQVGQGKGPAVPEKGQESLQVDALSILGYRNISSTYGVQGTQVLVPHSSESPPVASLLHLEVHSATKTHVI